MCFALLCFSSLSGKADESPFTISAEYLYWKAEQRSMDYMLTGLDSPVAFPGVASGTEKIHEPHYKWHSGFRVGIGYVFDECCFLRPELEYTHFQTNGSSLAHAIPNSKGTYQGTPGLPPSIPPITENFYPNGVPTVKDGHSKTRLFVDYLDLNLVGGDYCCCSFSWNWGFGARGVILKSNWHTDYLIQFSGLEVKLNTVFGPEKAKIDWRYDAGGIKLDGGFAYEVGCGFRFYQQVVGALMLGKLKTTSKATITHPNLGTVDICDVHKSRFKVVPVIQSETGFEYSYNWDCCFVMRAKVAFEYMKWFQVGENKFYTLPQAARFKDTCVDIDLYGLTAGLAIDF